MPPTPGRTSVRRALTLLSAVAVSTLSLVTVVPGTASRADDTAASPASAGTSRIVTLAASTNAETNKKAPATARTNVTTATTNKSVRAVYFTFPAITPAAGESVTAAKLVLRVTSVGRKKGTLVVRPVTGTWANGVISFRTRPAVGGIIGKAKVKRGTVTVTLRASAVTASLAAGLTVRINRSTSKALLKMAGTPTLSATLVTAAAPAAVTQTPSAAPTAPTTTPVTAETGAGMADKPVFAHYFPPFPVSLDNKAGASDYYATQYLLASGESGKFASTGGLLRDRPLTRNPISGDYLLADLRTEVDQAIAAGLDGFAVDILTTSNVDRNWTQILKLMTAARERAFKIMLQPDMSALGGISTGTFAQAMATLAGNDAAYRTSSGAVVISPFYAEARSASFYAEALGLMKSRYGVDAVLLPLFLDASDMADYAAISIGFANWGVRDATLARAGTNWAARAHALGKQWMEPVSVQDERPRDALYQEASNTETLRATWNRAISQDADAVLLTTWNDYSECTSFAPSTDHGTAFLELSKYFETKFKSGSYPTPTKDSVYIVNRIQKYSTLPTTYSNVMKLWYSTGSAPRDKVEVVTLLTRESDVTVTIGGQTSSYTAPAGFNAALFDLAPGTFTATVSSSGTSVTTKDAVSNTVEQQDLSYHAVSSNG